MAGGYIWAIDPREAFPSELRIAPRERRAVERYHGAIAIALARLGWTTAGLGYAFPLQIGSQRGIEVAWSVDRRSPAAPIEWRAYRPRGGTAIRPHWAEIDVYDSDRVAHEMDRAMRDAGITPENVIGRNGVRPHWTPRVSRGRIRELGAKNGSRPLPCTGLQFQVPAPTNGSRLAGQDRGLG